MKCLSAFGVIIDTTKPSVTGNADTNKTVRLYRIIGIKAIDLITGDIEERKCDIFDIDESDYADISIIDESDYNIFSMMNKLVIFYVWAKELMTIFQI